MPKEIKQYQCELCGAICDSEELASSCEQSHVHAESIDGEVYNVYSIIPDMLKIRMSNGSIVEYSLGGRTRL